MQVGARGGRMADINMTPMIDVLLVLLVIFMIAQPLLQKSLDVQLPVERSEHEAEASTAQIVLHMGADGSFAINTQPVPPGELADRLRAIYAARPDKVLFIDPDGELRYDLVIRAMDIARGAGVRVLGAVVSPPAGSDP